MFRYRAFGLSIASDIFLPELPEETRNRTLDLRIKRSPLPLDNSLGTGERSYLGVVETVGEFLFEDGLEMTVYPNPGIDPSRLRTTILGPAIAIILRQRGLAVLHGATVAMDGGAVVFLGSCGSGKSTTSSLFHAAGYGIGGDDVCPVDVDGAPCVWPSYPQIKLRKDAARALHGEVDHLQPLYRDDVRRLEEVPSRFPTGPLAIKKMYVLRFSNESGITPLPKHVALASLIEHARAIPPLSGRRYEQERMTQAAHIVETTPLALLTRPRAIEDAGQIVEMVRTDVGEMN